MARKKNFGVVVSGVGLVTPLGATRRDTWKSLLDGKTGIRFGENGLEASVDGVSPNGAHSRAGDFAILAAGEALKQAQIDVNDAAAGCAIGQSKPLLYGDTAGTLTLDPSLLLSSFTGWSLESVVRSHFRLTGPGANVAAACATGVAAIETAAMWIRLGVCDVALAGAAEASLNPFYRSGFEQMGVLASGNDPRWARPFDRNRNGFAMGEGAAVLVLESEESCQKRGSQPLARLAAVRLRQSPVDPVKFGGDGVDIVRLIKAVMDDGTAPGYVNAHGTGTLLNDAAEARALTRAFGANVTTTVGSTKASTGHLLGAAGAMEAAFSVLAVCDQVIPPSLHIDEPDPLCEFCLAGSRAEAKPINSALSLSYGFGGQMGAVLFERS